MFVSGRRRRVTLLRIGERAIDDAVAEARYRAVLTALGVTERARMPQETISRLCEWYTSTVMPARGNRPSTRVQESREQTAQRQRDEARRARRDRVQSAFDELLEDVRQLPVTLIRNPYVTVPFT